MSGLSMILRSQLDTRIPKRLVVRKAESRSLNVVLCFHISHYQTFSDLGCVALARAPGGLRIQLWAGDLAPASAADPLAVLSLGPHGPVIWQDQKHGEVPHSPGSQVWAPQLISKQR